MDITIAVSKAGSFRRILLSVSEKSKPVECELSAIVKSPSGKEEIFLQSPEKILPTATYAYSGGRFVTHIAPGKYQIICQPQEGGQYKLKLVGKFAGRPFQRELGINLD